MHLPILRSTSNCEEDEIRTQHNFSVEVVDKLGNKLAFDGNLMSQHAKIVAQLRVLRNDNPQACVFVLWPPRPPENLLHVQHACTNLPVINPIKPLSAWCLVRQDSVLYPWIFFSTSFIASAVLSIYLSMLNISEAPLSHKDDGFSLYNGTFSKNDTHIHLRTTMTTIHSHTSAKLRQYIQSVHYSRALMSGCPREPRKALAYSVSVAQRDCKTMRTWTSEVVSSQSLRAKSTLIAQPLSEVWM